MMLLLFALATTPLAGNAQPAVVVSIKPLHSLVAAVMQDVAEPTLLLEGSASPHEFVLKPSQARAIAHADLVVWVGPDLESPLIKAVGTLGPQAQSMPLLSLPDLQRLPVRDLDGVGGDDHGHKHDHKPANAHDHPAIDPHLWLDPHNARLIGEALVQALSRIDPTNADRYRSNGTALNAALTVLDQELARTLEPVRDIPFILFHDGFQYFEHRYHLAAVGIIAIDPERTPGARRIQQMRQRVAQTQARCVFAEPQFPPAMTRLVIEDSEVRAGLLDPLGSRLPPGAAQYAAMMRELAASFRQCLSAK